MRPAMSGAARSARAMFVSGPTGTSQTSSSVRHVSTMKPTASVPSSGVVGAGRSAPSRPLSPWTNAAALRFCDEWTGAAGVNRDVETQQVAHHEGVVGGALERRIARDGGDADELHVVGGGHDRHRVVVAGVAVEQHTCLHGPSMPSPVLDPRSDERSDGIRAVGSSLGWVFGLR